MSTVGKKSFGYYFKRYWCFVSVCLLTAGIYVVWFWYYQNNSPVALYHRVWLLANDWFYDREALKNWADYEHKYDDKIKNYDDAILYSNTMLKTLEDPFTKLLNPKQAKRMDEAQYGVFTSTGLTIKRVEEKMLVRALLPGGPAEKVGFRPGDELNTMDGIKCSTVYAYKIGEYSRDHLGKPIKFGVIRMKDGKPQHLVLTVVPIKVTLHPTRAKVLPGNIAYLRIENFARQEVDQQVQRDLEKLNSCDGLVLDLRANPGGSVDRCLAVAGLFLEKGVVSQLRSRVPHAPDEVIDYTLTPDDITIVTRSGANVVSTEHRPRFKQVFVGKKIIVMVDEFTASAAEMLAAALRENNRVTLLGSRTLGKGLAQIGIPLPHATSLSVTVGRYFTPSGYCPGDASEECGLDGRTPAQKSSWFKKKLQPKVQVETQEKLSEDPKAEGQGAGGGQSKEESLGEQKGIAVESIGKSAEKPKKEQGLIPDVEMPTPDVIEYCSDNDKQLVRAAAILRGAALLKDAASH